MKHLVIALAILAAAGCSADRSATDAAVDLATPRDDTATAPAPPVVDTTPLPVEAAPGTPSPDTGSATVPARFRGQWAADAAACAQAGHESHLTIEAGRIQFHESSGAIQSVNSGPSELTVVARLTGEGETRDATYRFRLSDDGNTLTDLGSGTGMARQRCS